MELSNNSFTAIRIRVSLKLLLQYISESTVPRRLEMCFRFWSFITACNQRYWQGQRGLAQNTGVLKGYLSPQHSRTVQLDLALEGLLDCWRLLIGSDEYKVSAISTSYYTETSRTQLERVSATASRAKMRRRSRGKKLEITDLLASSGACREYCRVDG